MTVGQRILGASMTAPPGGALDPTYHKWQLAKGFWVLVWLRPLAGHWSLHNISSIFHWIIHATYRSLGLRMMIFGVIRSSKRYSVDMRSVGAKAFHNIELWFAKMFAVIRSYNVDIVGRLPVCKQVCKQICLADLYNCNVSDRSGQRHLIT